MDADALRRVLDARRDIPGEVQGERASRTGADLRRAIFAASRVGAVLAGADLSGAILRGADLTGTDLTGADLRGADLSGADLRGADLTGTVLIDTDLRRADLCGADLTSASLRRADLCGADLTSASLRRADLRGADLSDAAGIITAGPVGSERRTVVAVDHGDRIMVQAGCWWGTIGELTNRIAHGGGHGWHHADEAQWRAEYETVIAYIRETGAAKGWTSAGVTL